jgi:integrase
MVSASRSGIRFPSLRRHKASGQAVVTVRGRDIYCGRYGTPEADETYRRVIAELVSSGPEVVRHHGLAKPGRGQHAFTPPTRRPITVAELLLAYVEHAERYYQAPSREIEIIRVTCRAVRELFGSIAASEFGARQLKAVRQQWIDQKQARKYINARISRIARMWRWAAEEELVPASSWHALQSLSGLRAGRSAAKEPERKKPVPEADFQRALTGLPAPVRAILEVLWWTGARSGEICSLRTCDIVRDCEPWQYCPERHKNSHRGHKRAIFFGPRARAVLQPFLDDENPERFLFSPADAVRAQKETAKVPHRSDARRAQAAATKRRIEAKQRLAKSGKSRPTSSRRPGARYNRNSLANALRRCCSRLEVPYFNPHRLRHTARVRIDELVGEAASAAVSGVEFASEESQATLSHSSRKMTQRYGSTCYGLAAITMERYG